MTREEATEYFKMKVSAREAIGNDIGADYEAYKIALSALRPVSREGVEKAWRGEWITKHYVDGILEGTNFDECSKCGYQRVFENPELKTKYIFCPNCGAPMTDEAVDMVMERLEALYEAT